MHYSIFVPSQLISRSSPSQGGGRGGDPESERSNGERFDKACDFIYEITKARGLRRICEGRVLIPLGNETENRNHWEERKAESRMCICMQSKENPR